ncbi:hypothetical protein [Kitasatospora sp. CB01950]|uniref:hypothetical protein n=1 Tax=Kitasatospora sp. CB01950 TaxID=1703930 RepID=UPI00093CCAB3|nr:hypothetical protein [Kitasatospora sp. CB01950]OKJ05582.1 hypothetical protein AMK19_25065 [Kitasatospora sp. CB01950]
MEVLRGSHRVHFVAAWVLCAVELLCLAATVPPLRWVAPAWLWASTLAAIVLVFAAALARSWSVPFLRRDRVDGLPHQLRRLPRGVKLCYVLTACLIAVGLATGSDAAEVHKDATGYYWTKAESGAHGRTLVRTEIGQAEYDRRRGAEVRIFTGVPAAFAVIGSFLVLAAALTSFGAADDPRTGRRRRRR